MAGTVLTDDDIMGMSDEEILAAEHTPRQGSVEAPMEEGQADEPESAQPEEPATQSQETGEDAGADDGLNGGDADGASGSDEDDEVAALSDEDIAAGKKPAARTKPEAKDDTGQVQDAAPQDPAPAQEPDEKKDLKPEAPKDAIDYKAAYEKLMAPFRANGKEIKLDNPDEAVRLMQMGANYTKKLQALQPHLKMIRMLENHGLMDETKLSRLIDLEKKNPAAIKQLVKESGLDPMDIDTSEDTGYTPGNYQVPDSEMAFASAVEEAASEPGGKELISAIRTTWDADSKKAIFADPGVLQVLTTQRKNGIYGQIVAEVERRKMLGYIPANAPFLTTYHKVGIELEKGGRLKPVEERAQAPSMNQQKPSVQQASTGNQAAPEPKAEADTGRKVLDRGTSSAQRPAQTTLPNNDKARAASPTKSAPSKGVLSDFNPLAMSDEDFEKQAALGRRF